MKYRKFGRTGFEVSDIAHGLWGMGGWSGSDDEESLKALQLAVELGCNFFDSAWAYGDGKSDGLLGEIIARNPHKRLYAASKIPPKNLQWPASPKYKGQKPWLLPLAVPRYGHRFSGRLSSRPASMRRQTRAASQGRSGRRFRY